DGSTPDSNSPVYDAPIDITGTSMLRAAVVGPGLLEMPPATATWLFLDDILAQSSTPLAEWPASREVNNHFMLYGMEQTIVTGDNARLRQGMMDIPSLSLVTDLDNLFAPDSGIYSHSNQSFGWERPASVELIDPQGNSEEEFQIDIGLRLRGAYSRLLANPKHSFRFFFRSATGDRDLDFPLFGDEGPSSFKKVDLRTAQNYSWAFQPFYNSKNTFVREVFSRDTQRDMGMPHTRSRYYHLFLNGQYWGLYMTQERGDNDWAEDHLGGDRDDWDNIKTGHPGYVTTATDGNNDAWYALHDMTVNEGFSGAFADNYWRVRGLNPDGSPNPNYPAYVDEDNLIEYMLISHYTGDNDSPVSKSGMPNNINTLFNRVNPTGFKWLRHDAEHSLGARDGVNLDTTALGTSETARDRFNPALLHWELSAHPEYRMRVADLMQKHVFGNGALTPENAKARLQSRMAEIDYAIIGESARWGRGHTRDGSWVNGTNYILDYLDQRRDIVVDQYRNRSWFPSIDAPEMSVVGAQVQTSSTVPFYYMTDGSDPRLTGGGVHPDAVLADGTSEGDVVEVIARDTSWEYYDVGEEPPTSNGLAWHHPDYPSGSWSSGPALLGFAGSSPQNDVATQTNRWVSGTSGPQVITTYFRREFTLDSIDEDIDLMLEILRDDGAVVYLNGVEILRENMPAGADSYDTYATTYDSANHTTWYARHPDAADLLRPGVNVLAASVHQVNATSSDKYFGLSLAVASPPEPVEHPVHLATGIRARAYQDGEWSALSAGSYLEDLPEPAVIHQWDHESSDTYLEPSYTLGGGASLGFTPGPATEVVRHPEPAKDYDSPHLRVNDPLGATLTWSLPSTGVGGLHLKWETRRSGKGAGTQIVEITTDGVTWSPLETYTVLDAAPQSREFDLTGIADTEDNPDLAVRVSFAQGDGGTAGNNRFDNVTLEGIVLPDPEAAVAISFDPVPTGAQSGSALGPVVVRALDASGNPAVGFDGPVTISLSRMDSRMGLTGTLTVNAVNGVATFDDLAINATGVRQLTATADDMDPATSGHIRVVSLTGLIVPQYIQGNQDFNGDNNDRVPFAWHARIDGLEPNATYRFANRVVVPGDEPDNDGAGNMIFATSPTENWMRTTDSPDFEAGQFGSGHFSLTTDSDGSFTGWFLTEPSGNPRFTPGNQVHFRLLLNDGAGGQEEALFLTTAESAEVIRFGTGPGEGTAVIGESSAPARRLAVLYPDAGGSARPLAATPVEVTGAATDSRYAAFYGQVVATSQSHWGTILPNSLADGLQRVEIRSSGSDAGLLASYENAAGFPGTTNPSGGMAQPVVLDTDSGLPTFLPGDSALWHSAPNWSDGNIPNTSGASAILNAPATADRNVDIEAATTVGMLRVNQATTNFRNRLRTDSGSGSLTFDGDTHPATLRVDGSGGSGHLDVDFSSSVTLATDLALLVNQADGGDPKQGALRLQQTWTGPGGLVKQGPGMAALTGEGKSFTGPLVIEQGVLRVTGPAVPAAAGAVKIHPGGQLRLTSTGTPGEPRVHGFGGGAIELGGLGRGGDLPTGQGLGLLGALRYDPGSQDNVATVANALEFTSDTDIHIDGTRNALRLDGAITGNGHKLIKTGGGTLEIAAASPAFAEPSIDVQRGTLSLPVNHPAPITLAAETVLTGNGSIGPVTGAGTVAPGTRELTATQSGAARIAAVLTTPGGGSEGNGALVLTSMLDPLPAAPQTIDLFLDPDATPVPGDRFQGGLVVPADFDLTSALAATTVNLYLADPAGGIEHLGGTYRAVDPTDELTWAVAGETLEVLQTGSTSTYEQWRQLNFADSAEQADDDVSGPSATDETGTANLFRYAFGLDHDEPTSAATPQLGKSPSVFRFAHDPAKSDLIWLVLASPDLSDWSEVLFDSRIHAAPEADADGRIAIPYPEGRPSLFLRLELQLSP
ncbi:MAG: CotH kinase family protein, partial [Opitutales bacterium]